MLLEQIISLFRSLGVTRNTLFEQSVDSLNIAVNVHGKGLRAIGVLRTQ
jgi:hypothetical protein